MKRGSLLLEGLGGLWLSVAALGLNLELVRSAQYHAVLHHAGFITARARALGGSEAVNRKDILQFFSQALTQGEADRLRRSAELTVERVPPGILARVRYRYPLFFRFLQTRFQVTKTCLFSL